MTNPAQKARLGTDTRPGPDLPPKELTTSTNVSACRRAGQGAGIPSRRRACLGAGRWARGQDGAPHALNDLDPYPLARYPSGADVMGCPLPW
jgi:hypothetical protein